MKRLANHSLALNLGMAAVYLVAAKIGLSLAFGTEQVTAVWPPTGIALASVLIWGYRICPGIFVGAFLANSTAHEPLMTALGIGAGNTLEACCGAYLLRRLSDFSPTLERVRDVVPFLILAVGLSTMVSATVGTLSLCLGGVHSWDQAGSLWLLWWLGDAMGNLVVAPVLLTWAYRESQWREANKKVALALFVGLILANLGIFCGRNPSANPGYPLEYLVFPLVIGAAFACGQRGAATAAGVTSIIAIIGTVQGSGPFSGGLTSQNLVLLQLFMGVVAVTGMLLGAALMERKDAEGALQRSNERSRFAMEAGEVGVFEWDIRTGRVYWSDNLFTIHQTDPKSGGGSFNTFMADVHPEDQRQVARVVSRSLETGGRYEVEYRSQTKSGSIRWYSAKGMVVKDDHGASERMIGVCSDVTARRELEESLRAADRQKDQFVAMLAHELRNPLAPIRNAAHLLEAAPNGVSARRQVAVIQRQAAHMARLLDDLLDVSRITRGQVTLQKAKVDLVAIVTRAVEDIGSNCERLGQRLEFHPPSAPTLINADPARMYQIVANLLQNASKYTEPGGSIQVEVIPGQEWVTLRVLDTGVGIDAAFLPRVFDLFSQHQSSISRSEGGLGIGLTLVKTLATLHGGTVSANSEGSGKGSQFEVRLPAEWAPTPPESPAGPELEPNLKRRQSLRILIVDDNQDAALTLCELMELWGHQAAAVGDGPSALREAKEQQPDAVLLDIGLPGIDGYEVASRLRAEPEGKGVLLIAVTGYGQDDDRARAAEAGFDRHLTKPVEPELLRSILDSLRPSEAG